MRVSASAARAEFAAFDVGLGGNTHPDLIPQFSECQALRLAYGV